MIRTGIDILKIERIKEKIENQSFYNNCFTDYERQYAQNKQCKTDENKKYQTLAGIFSGKEALLKAIGSGVKNLNYLKQIEITHEASGRPVVNVWGEVGDIIKSLNCSTIDISISHDGEYAVAVCVLN